MIKTSRLIQFQIFSDQAHINDQWELINALKYSMSNIIHTMELFVRFPIMYC